MKYKKYDPLKHVAKTGALLTTETLMHGVAWNITGSLAPSLPLGGGAQMVRATQTADGSCYTDRNISYWHTIASTRWSWCDAWCRQHVW